MSLMPFFKNFVGAKGAEAASSLASALVRLDPESASRADLLTMEQDLDRAGGVIAKLRADLAGERRELDAITKTYRELMGAAEVLQGQINDPAAPESDKASKQASLTKLLARLESVVPELNRDKQDVAATESLLNDAQSAYKEKADALVAAKGNLERARHDLQHAEIQEGRSHDRAEQAAVVAGLKSSPTSGLTTALNVMQESADAARRRAESADMKAAALSGAQSSSEDPNIAAALAQSKGEPQGATSLADRLAALKGAA